MAWTTTTIARPKTLVFLHLSHGNTSGFWLS